MLLLINSLPLSFHAKAQFLNAFYEVEGESKKSLQAQILAINEKSAIFAQSS